MSYRDANLDDILAVLCDIRRILEDATILKSEQAEEDLPDGVVS